MATWSSCIGMQGNSAGLGLAPGPAYCCDLSKRGSLVCKISTKLVHGYSASTGKQLCPLREHAERSGIVKAAVTSLEEPVEKENSDFAHVLTSISKLYSEVGEEMKAAAEYVLKTGEGNGRAAADYDKRAYRYGRSAEMVAASKRKREGVVEELERLHGAVMEVDTGRTAADYLRRAELFSKSAEVFGNKLPDGP